MTHLKFSCTIRDGKPVCNCKHGTEGETCNKCMPFFHDRPWQRGTKENPNECVRKYTGSPPEVNQKLTGSGFLFYFQDATAIYTPENANSIQKLLMRIKNRKFQ